MPGGLLLFGGLAKKRYLYGINAENMAEQTIGRRKNLLPLYAPAVTGINGRFNLKAFKDDLYQGNPNGFMERLEALFKDLPGEDHRESTYRAFTYLLCILSGTEVLPERHSYKSRSDLEALTPEYVYLFELKYNKSVHEAMDQIHSRDYGGRYAKDNRKIFLIGANYVENKNERSLDYQIEEIV